MSVCLILASWRETNLFTGNWIMDRITVNDEIAEKIKRFPKRVYLCDEQGNSQWFIERIDPAELPEEQILTTSEIETTLRNIFIRT
jgi:hypothetical protein